MPPSAAPLIQPRSTWLGQHVSNRLHAACPITCHNRWHSVCYFFPAGILVSGRGNANAASAIILRWAAFSVWNTGIPRHVYSCRSRPQVTTKAAGRGRRLTEPFRWPHLFSIGGSRIQLFEWVYPNGTLRRPSQLKRVGRRRLQQPSGRQGPSGVFERPPAALFELATTPSAPR
jgi:hypothetical protein